MPLHVDNALGGHDAVHGEDFDVVCSAMSVEPLDSPPTPGGHQVAAPVWDETTRRFWCATSLNAYDIPDGDVWKMRFREAMGQYAPEVAERLHVELPVRNVATPSRRVERAESPHTPTRNPARPQFDCPKSPMKCNQNPSQNRAARAAHTRALMSLRSPPGVSVVVQGREVAVYRFGGKLFTAAARCPHQGGNLCDGEIGDIEDMGTGRCRTHYVTCPVHKMQFDLKTGQVLDGDCPPLEVYDVRIGYLDEQHKIALVEIGFKSLADEYFGSTSPTSF